MFLYMRCPHLCLFCVGICFLLCMRCPHVFLLYELPFCIYGVSALFGVYAVSMVVTYMRCRHLIFFCFYMVCQDVWVRICRVGIYLFI